MKTTTKKMRRLWKGLIREIVVHRPNVKLAKAVMEMKSPQAPTPNPRIGLFTRPHQL